MNNQTLVNGSFLATLVLTMVLPLSAMADEKYDELQATVELLQQQLQQVQETLKQYQENAASKEEVAELKEQVSNSVSKEEVLALETEVAQASEWKNPNTLIHMSGYADVGYANAENSDGSFNVGTFSPIFHYQYRDLVMLESELEFEVTDEGETELALEYLTVDLFLNDYLALVGGKFLSPIGQFRQNLHPSWINKLASAPPGFGHDGAAPVSELGFQARGGFPVGDMFANYAAYIGNGPELISTFEDGEFELQGIEGEGFGKDVDGKKVYGGRFAFLPLPGFEIGVSAATGKAAVTALELAHGDEEAPEEPDEHDEDGEDSEEPGFSGDLGNEPPRNYDVFGFDFAWSLNNIRARGEYVKTKIGSDEVGATASPGESWETWYAQTSYLIPSTKWEAALRYTDFNSPHGSQDQKQWAIGLNYLFGSSVMGKFTYELNDGEAGAQSDADRWMFQLAYGF
jgi:hypothetical protein